MTADYSSSRQIFQPATNSHDMRTLIIGLTEHFKSRNPMLGNRSIDGVACTCEKCQVTQSRCFCFVFYKAF